VSKREWAEREAAAALQRAAARKAVLGENQGPIVDRHDADYAPDAAFTLTAGRGDYDWFDLGELRGIGLAMEQAAAYRQDSRLTSHWIRVYAGSRRDGHTLREIALLSELE
jgi:hypothetical protein